VTTRSCSIVLFLLITLLGPYRLAFGNGITLFDFNDLPTSRKHNGNNYSVIESYMESLYGSDITVSAGTTAAKGADVLLQNGKGKNSGLAISFGASPINSFAVDWQVFKKGTGILIKVDGVVIYQDLLSKSEKKSGVADHLGPFFFDHPIHTLEFIGVKNSKIGIDNLSVNIPSPENGSGNLPEEPWISQGGYGEEGGNENGYPGGWGGSQDGGVALQTQPEAAVPEPPALILFGFGLISVAVFAKIMTPTAKDQYNNTGVN
jgi:hypothetical protein